MYFLTEKQNKKILNIINSVYEKAIKLLNIDLNEEDEKFIFTVEVDHMKEKETGIISLEENKKEFDKILKILIKK